MDRALSHYRTPLRVLPLLALSTLFASSVWFATNAVMPSLAQTLGGDQTPADITSAVQLGFIVGTFVFAALAIADRFAPSRVFMISSLMAAITNYSIVWVSDDYSGILITRFFVGFFLAGIYPVGMKIAVSWYPKGLGMALGFMVGALVLGTAFPHLVRALGQDWPWQTVIQTTSLSAIGGGLIIWLLLGDGPNRPVSGELHPRALLDAFRHSEFRASACGYFGHMWELYTFLAFVPVWLIAYQEWHQIDPLPVSLWSFLIIGAGAIGCAGGGLLTPRIGPPPVAGIQLTVSGICCLLSPVIFLLPLEGFLFVMLMWGLTVAGDSPQFSTMNALNAPPQLAGSALTMVNCIGFSISIISLQVMEMLVGIVSAQWLFLILVPGPLLGMIYFRPLLMKRTIV